jgi:hypothetical protein
VVPHHHHADLQPFEFGHQSSVDGRNVSQTSRASRKRIPQSGYSALMIWLRS